jgi:hypothetical protein
MDLAKAMQREGRHYPQVVRGLYAWMEDCNSVGEIHCGDVRKDLGIRARSIVFSAGSGGRVIVEMYLDRKKYPFIITPAKEATTTSCVSEIYEIVDLTAYKHFQINGEEKFFRPPESMLFHRFEEKPMQTGILDASVVNADEVEVLPSWWEGKPRLLAAYTRLCEMALNDDCGFIERIDDISVRVNGAPGVLAKYFDCEYHAADTALRQLRELGLVGASEVGNGKERKLPVDTSHYRNLPKCSPKELWNSVPSRRRRKNKEGKQAEGISGDTAEPIIPNDIQAQLQLMAKLQENLRASVPLILENIYRENAEILRVRHQLLKDCVNPVRHLLDEKNLNLLGQISDTFTKLEQLCKGKD